jgi:hypothetical protein
VKSVHHIARIAASAAVVVLSTLAVAGPASAQTLGPLKITPATGQVETAPVLWTSGPCPTAANAVIAKIYGPGFPVRGQNMTGDAPGNESSKHAFSVDATYTMRDLAGIPYPPVAYLGKYTIVVTCRKLDDIKSLGDFVGTMTFTTPTTYTTAQGGKIPATPKPGVPVTKPVPTVQPTPTATVSPTPRATVSPSASSTPTSSPSASVSNSAPGGNSASGASSSSTNALIPALIGLLVGAGVVGTIFFIRGRRPASK